MPSIRATKPASSKREPGRTSPAVDASPPSAPADSAAAPTAATREALIRIAAYAFYERRGYVAGHELEDWLRAEMEVDQQLSGAQEPKRPT